MSDFPSRLEAVLFDLDGTLLDTAAEFIDAVQQLRAEHQLAPLPAAAIRAVVSDGARAMVSLALNICVDDDIFEERRQRFLDIYRAQLGSNTHAYPGIRELIGELHRAGIPWGVSTNKPSYLAGPLLASMNFTPTPASTVCPDHVSRPKPDPEPLLLNARQLGVRPENVIYIGDHRRDIEAGKAAGMHTIAAAYGYIHHSDEPAEWAAHSTAADSLELAALVRVAFNQGGS